uniref:dUTPase-like domain-containing protein n=1 Tax=Dromaius novaehollandiae TaxID=8790 RepID=A0A8C4P6A9_DRONO
AWGAQGGPATPTAPPSSMQRGAAQLHMLRVQWLHPQACLPRRALPGSAGLDLSHLVSMAITIPQGYYGHVVPCNSLALQEGGIHAGVIDSDCLEEVKVANIGKARLNLVHRLVAPILRLCQSRGGVQ